MSEQNLEAFDAAVKEHKEKKETSIRESFGLTDRRKRGTKTTSISLSLDSYKKANTMAAKLTISMGRTITKSELIDAILEIVDEKEMHAQLKADLPAIATRSSVKK